MALGLRAFALPVPEGDTIHRTAARLRPALIGRRLEKFEAPRLVGLRPRIGSTIESVEATGKHLEIGFDDGIVLHTHMRMAGSWHLYRPGETWRRRLQSARVVVQVEGWMAVCFNAPLVEVYRAEDRRRHPGLGSLGPDLCRRSADLDACVDRMEQYADDHQEIADVLLDQRICCGVGNVYKSEVLWACRLDPRTQLRALAPRGRRVLVETAADLLQANLGGGERTTVTGGVAVYGRAGKPCLRCHTPIEVIRQGIHARVTYWCPGCQLRPAP
jgi:endonuclease-8